MARFTALLRLSLALTPPLAIQDVVLAQSNDAQTTTAEISTEAGISLSFNKALLPQVLSQISRKSGREIVARGALAQSRVTIITRNKTLAGVIEQLTQNLGGAVAYEPHGLMGPLELWDADSYRTNVLPTMVRQKVFLPREIAAEDAYKAIAGILTPNIGSASFDPRSNKVIVTDVPEVLELAQSLLEQIDVGFVTRVFYIKRNDVEAIAEKIAALKSPAAPEPDVDLRTHQVVVRDRLENIRKMELLVEILDGNRTQLKTYPAPGGTNADSVPKTRGRKL